MTQRIVEFEESAALKGFRAFCQAATVVGLSKDGGNPFLQADALLPVKQIFKDFVHKEASRLEKLDEKTSDDVLQLSRFLNIVHDASYWNDAAVAAEVAEGLEILANKYLIFESGQVRLQEEMREAEKQEALLAKGAAYLLGGGWGASAAETSAGRCLCRVVQLQEGDPESVRVAVMSQARDKLRVVKEGYEAHVRKLDTASALWDEGMREVQEGLDLLATAQRLMGQEKH